MTVWRSNATCQLTPATLLLINTVWLACVLLMKWLTCVKLKCYAKRKLNHILRSNEHTVIHFSLSETRSLFPYPTPYTAITKAITVCCQGLRFNWEEMSASGMVDSTPIVLRVLWESVKSMKALNFQTAWKKWMQPIEVGGRKVAKRGKMAGRNAGGRGTVQGNREREGGWWEKLKRG